MTKYTPSTRWLFSGVLVAVLLGGSGCAGAIPAGSPDSGSATDAATPPPLSASAESEVSGPSSEPANAAGGGPPPSASAAAGLAEVRPEITYAGVSATGSSIEASSYVPGIVESNGLCTFRVSAGTQELTLVQPALADATTTSCGSATIALDGANATGWTVVVEYRSPSSSGASLPMTVSGRA